MIRRGNTMKVSVQILKTRRHATTTGINDSPIPMAESANVPEQGGTEECFPTNTIVRLVIHYEGFLYAEVEFSDDEDFCSTPRTGEDWRAMLQEVIAPAMNDHFNEFDYTLHNVTCCYGERVVGLRA